MLFKLPPVFGINAKSAIGTIRQLLIPAREISGIAVKLTIGSQVGHLVTLDEKDGKSEIFLFSTKPKPNSRSAYAAVIVAKTLPAELGEVVNLEEENWLCHPTSAMSDPRQAALDSWRAGFHYIDERSVGEGRIGLRCPQLGALHAIHAHWSTSKGIATVVMPTGTGKTETMLAAMISASCARILVVVPTHALRTQVADKFLTLGVLKHERTAVLSASIQRPVVGMLTSIPSDPVDLEDFVEKCNVVVLTSMIASRCSDEICNILSTKCSHLFIDEAHHAEAPTWKTFKARFVERTVLQFTATPFRADGQPLDGKIIYVYPLRQAQAEGYFRPIRFSGVYAYNPLLADQAIAQKVIDELAADATSKHVAMARVSNHLRAKDVFAIYTAMGRYNPVMLHSGMGSKDQAIARQMLLNGSARIVVCVDMLGEGFDMPELKIAAFHDLRKSLPVTLQLAGRFTRGRADLGDPVFIANTADVDLTEELRSLYSQDPDWNGLLPELSDGAIAGEIETQQFIAGFDGHIDELPLSELRPAASMVIYRTSCANWTPKNFAAGFKGLSGKDRVYPLFNELENTLVVVTATSSAVPWTDLAPIRDFTWELLLAVWDSKLGMLFIHGSNNNGLYTGLAKALCGEGVALVVEPEVYRAFSGINRLMLNNVGLNEHMGRQIRYTSRMGPDVGARLSDATLATTRKAVLAGAGFENGKPASIGAAKRGRIWSNLRLRVNTFVAWCRHVGAKVADSTIDSEEVLKGTLVPKVVESRPSAVAIGADWPIEILDDVESATVFELSAVKELRQTDVGLDVLDAGPDAPLILRFYSDHDEVQVRLEFVGLDASADFKFVYQGVSSWQVRRGKSAVDLCKFLTDNPPIIWFSDGSSLEGNFHTELRTESGLYNVDKLHVVDWSGVDITKESQREERRSDSVQFRTIERLKAIGDYMIIFDDDGAGEAADVVAIRIDNADHPKNIDVELYHCKYSMEKKAGARVDDLYVVCGQAQRSVMWLHNKGRRTDLFAHLLKREATRVESGRPTRIEFGTTEELNVLRDLSRRCNIRLYVFIVQPGLSKAMTTNRQMALLGVTERFLYETYQVPFSVLCHL